MCAQAAINRMMWQAILVSLLVINQVRSQSTPSAPLNTVQQPVTTPATSRNVQTPGSPNIPPLVTQCFYESKWYPAGAIINAGRSGNLCYGAYCDLDGHVKHWGNNNCPKPDSPAPKPPFPVFPKPTVPDQTPSPATQPPFQFQGCFYGEKYYFPGEYIQMERRGGICSGLYCDFTSSIRPWMDYCRDFIMPFPVDLT